MAKTNVIQTQSEERILDNYGYKLLSKLGEGAYAKVYLSEFRVTEEKKILLACKLIDTSKTPKKFVDKFLPRELKVLMKIDHPHIVQIHSIFQRRNKYYIFMRNAEQGDLLDFLMNNGPVSENQARFWTRQLALAVQYIHLLEIGHRDIKCENILITAKHNAKLSDFGFSRYLLRNDGRRDFSETFCGSLSYASPEILKAEPYNPKVADIWSIGIVLFTMLNKSYPFDEKDVRALYKRQIKNKWKFRTRYVGRLSEEVKTLITNLLEPDVEKRYRVEQIIQSDWIAMDPKLTNLNPQEFRALNLALDVAKSLAVKDTYETQRRRSTLTGLRRSRDSGNSINFFKKFETNFLVNLNVSEYNKT